MESKICKQCKKEFIRVNQNDVSWKNKLFCSRKCKSINRYYRNRKKLISKQREYDKNHKEIKRAYDTKRRLTKDKCIKEIIQDYSRNHYFELLYKIYNGCQLCKSKDNLEIHHKNYTKDIQDCMLLCRNCHRDIHRKYNKDITLE